MISQSETAFVCWLHLLCWGHRYWRSFNKCVIRLDWEALMQILSQMIWWNWQYILRCWFYTTFTLMLSSAFDTACLYLCETSVKVHYDWKFLVEKYQWGKWIIIFYLWCAFILQHLRLLFLISQVIYGSWISQLKCFFLYSISAHEAIDIQSHI